jgi:hypothetical protein
LGYLKLHIRKKHRENIQCPICGFAVKNLPGLETHCFVSTEEKHKALYYLLHKNSTAVNTKVSIENLKKYKHLFEVKEGIDDGS